MAPGKIIDKALGKTTAEHLANVAYLANLQMIRVNDFQIFQEFKEKIGSLDTTSEQIFFDQFKVGWVYIITHISAVEIGTGTPQIKIGASISGKDFIFESATVGNAEDSVEYVGQLMLKEGDKVFADFESATVGDTATIFMIGYKIRR